MSSGGERRSLEREELLLEGSFEKQEERCLSNFAVEVLIHIEIAEGLDEEAHRKDLSSNTLVSDRSQAGAVGRENENRREKAYLGLEDKAVRSSAVEQVYFHTLLLE